MEDKKLLNFAFVRRFHEAALRRKTSLPLSPNLLWSLMMVRMNLIG